MSLASGTRLGAYTISSLIGQGGMGVVYRARPARLAFEARACIFSSTRDPFVDAAASGRGERQVLVTDGGDARYASGHLMYDSGGTLMAVSFDPARLQVEGTPVPVIQGVQHSGTGAANFSLSSNGSPIYVPGGLSTPPLAGLVWVDRRGYVQPTKAPSLPANQLSLSPDGKEVAIGLQKESGNDIWIDDLATDTLRRLTCQGTDLFPVWTPDGKRIAFTSNAGLGLVWQPADGSGPAQQMGQAAGAPSSWSPDGHLLLYEPINAGTGIDLWVQPVDASGRAGTAFAFLQSKADEVNGRFSPDGRWVAYASDVSGRLEVYVRPFPGPGGKWQISTDGGLAPQWSADGSELFFRYGNKMLVSEVVTKPSFSASATKVLFQGPFVGEVPLPVEAYAVSPDGRRFLMLQPVQSQGAGPGQVNLVQNWPEELPHP